VFCKYSTSGYNRRRRKLRLLRLIFRKAWPRRWSGRHPIPFWRRRQKFARFLRSLQNQAVIALQKCTSSSPRPWPHRRWLELIFYPRPRRSNFFVIQMAAKKIFRRVIHVWCIHEDADALFFVFNHNNMMRIRKWARMPRINANTILLELAFICGLASVYKYRPESRAYIE